MPWLMTRRARAQSKFACAGCDSSDHLLCLYSRLLEQDLPGHIRWRGREFIRRPAAVH